MAHYETTMLNWIDLSARLTYGYTRERLPWPNETQYRREVWGALEVAVVPVRHRPKDGLVGLIIW